MLGGLHFREGRYICEVVHETGCLVAMDIVEVNPLIEPKYAERTVDAACSLVRCAFGMWLLFTFLEGLLIYDYLRREAVVNAVLKKDKESKRR